MSIIHTPRIRVVGRQEINYRAIDAFIKDNTNKLIWATDTEIGAEQLIEMAGRTCYLSFGSGRKTNKSYINNVLEMKHGSVFEHAVWNFIISGVSRSFTHELVRHRAGWGYSQLSQRFVDESNANFIVPTIINDDPEAYMRWEKFISDAQQAYNNLIDILEDNLDVDIKEDPKEQTKLRKMIRGAARSVLPNATETIIFCTANARAIRHFIELRASPYTDDEMRRVAIELLRIMQDEAPNIFSDYKIETLEDGSEIAVTENIKV